MSNMLGTKLLGSKTKDDGSKETKTQCFYNEYIKGQATWRETVNDNSQEELLYQDEDNCRLEELKTKRMAVRKLPDDEHTDSINWGCCTLRNY